MLFDTANAELVTALAYWLKGHGVRYQFEFAEDESGVTAVTFHDDIGQETHRFVPGEMVVLP